MIYCDARVSNDARDLGNQAAQLKAAGCEKVFREKMTGAAMPGAGRKLAAALLRDTNSATRPAFRCGWAGDEEGSAHRKWLICAHSGRLIPLSENFLKRT
jgi:hypothetical protein